MTVTIGSETPTPFNTSETLFQIQVGPQPPGSVSLEVAQGPNSDTASFPFISGARRVFVTSSSFASDGDLAGLAGADQICMNAAAVASLPGSYLAWLGDTANGPSTRFTQNSGPYVDNLGGVIANDYADLTDGTLLIPIDVTESGSVATGVVWTNVIPDGTTAGAANSCLDWATNSGASNGATGVLASTGAWTALAAAPCPSTALLYCFQQ